MLTIGLVQGALVLITVLAVYLGVCSVVFRRRKSGPCRSPTLATLALLLWLPFTQRLFGLAVMHASDLGICVAAGVLSVLWFEGYKLIRGRGDLAPT